MDHERVQRVLSAWYTSRESTGEMGQQILAEVLQRTDIGMSKELEEQKEKATGDEAIAGKEVTGKAPMAAKPLHSKVLENSTALGMVG